MATKRWAFEFLAKGQYQRTAPFTKNPILTTSSQPKKSFFFILFLALCGENDKLTEKII